MWERRFLRGQGIPLAVAGKQTAPKLGGSDPIRSVAQDLGCAWSYSLPHVVSIEVVAGLRLAPEPGRVASLTRLGPWRRVQGRAESTLAPNVVSPGWFQHGQLPTRGCLSLGGIEGQVDVVWTLDLVGCRVGDSAPSVGYGREEGSPEPRGGV